MLHWLDTLEEGPVEPPLFCFWCFLRCWTNMKTIGISKKSVEHGNIKCVWFWLFLLSLFLLLLLLLLLLFLLLLLLLLLSKKDAKYVCNRFQENRLHKKNEQWNSIGSMQGLFTYIWIKFMENIDKYSTAIERLGFASQKEWAGNLEAPRQGMTFAEHKNNSHVFVGNDCRLKNIYNIRDINECLNSRWFHVRSQILLKPIPSMYGIFIYIHHTHQPNVG